MAKLSQAQIDFANEFQTPAQALAATTAAGNALAASNAADMAAINSALAAINGSNATAPAANPNTGYVEGGTNAAALSAAAGLNKPATNTSTGPVVPTGSTKPSGSTGSVANTGPSAADIQNRQNIFDAVKAQMTQWGILIPGDATSNALVTTLQNLAMQGAGADTVSLALQNSDAYKARFAGNTTRVANGLSALSPADYIATEQAYDQILRSAGVPAGYYSSAADKAKLIGADISASELQSRVDLAKQSISQADPFYTNSLKNLYGLSSGDMIAHVLDPSAALPLITQQVNSAQIAAEAARAGSGIGLPLANQLAGQGVTQAQAAQGFQQIATQQPALQSIATRYGAGLLTQPNIGSALEAATFGTTVNGINQAQASQQLDRLKTAETSAFSGSAGAATGSLGLRDTSGLS